jgi:Domain of unknown function (DUF4281)
MTANQIFSVANVISMGCWLLLIVLPRRPWVGHVVNVFAIPAFAVLYTVIIAIHFAGSEGGFSSLPDVALLFSNPWLLLAGWIHYLAFDLFVGSWEVRDSRERGISHMLVVPCLILTFLFGPAGWLLYLAVRTGVHRTARPSER